MSKPVILTGIRSNEDPTIGNYFGALLPLIDMAKNHADNYQINLFVPDLHSFTTPIKHDELYQRTINNLKIFVAAGLPLDHPNVHMYRQSYIPAHSELTWILDCFTGFGQMSRMTQFKDKSKADDSLAQLKVLSKESRLLSAGDRNATAHVPDMSDPKSVAAAYIELSKKYVAEVNHNNDFVELLFKHIQNSDSTSVGLFNYPVLMAADILLYGASYVPVGDDQSQHLEFARDIAERMNSRFGELFIMPKAVKEQHEFFGRDQGLRIKDLADPTKKMSKSDATGKGVIFLGDSPESAAKKIKSATTDSLGKIDFMNQKQAGIRNLLQILALTKGKGYAETAETFQGSELYGSLKTAVAEAVGVFLHEFQQRLSQVDEAQLMAKLEADEALMNRIANETLLKVQKAIGLR